MAFCNKCGNPIKESTKFCTKCGNKIIADIPASPAMEATPATEKKKIEPGVKKSYKKVFLICICLLLVLGASAFSYYFFFNKKDAFAVVISDNLNLRRTPSDIYDTNIITNYKYGSRLKVVRDIGDWLFIQNSADEAGGYVKEEYVMHPLHFYILQNITSNNFTRDTIQKKEARFKQSLIKYFSNKDRTLGNVTYEEMNYDSSRFENPIIKLKQVNEYEHAVVSGKFNGSQKNSCAFLLANRNSNNNTIVVFLYDDSGKKIREQEFEGVINFIQKAGKGEEYIIDGEYKELKNDAVIIHYKDSRSEIILFEKGILKKSNLVYFEGC